MKKTVDHWLAEPDVARLKRAVNMRASQPAVALKELTELAHAGSAMSMLYIGHAFQEGSGVGKDLSLAEEWYTRAAHTGNVMGWYALGRVYLKQRRFDEARKVFRLGAAAGYAPAMNYMGRMYFFGWGERDVAKAKTFLEDASARGNIAAKRLLGHLLIHYPLTQLEFLRGICLTVVAFFSFLIALCTEGMHSEKFQ